MNEVSITELLENLKHPDEKVRHRATAELWRIWFYQKGAFGFELLQRSQALLEVGNTDEAKELLTELVRDMPDFTEAWNRRAVLHYILKQYRKAIADCNQVLELVPYHFGALHGLGLCHAALGNYREAIQAFRKALEVQPYAIENRRWILECTAKL